MGNSWKPWAAVGLMLLTAPPCLADVTIDGPSQVPAGKLVRLQAKGDVKGASCTWDVAPVEQADVLESGQSCIWTGPAGTYSVLLTSYRLVEGAVVVERARATVVIGQPAPPVPPVPPPAPPANGFAPVLRAAWAREKDASRVSQAQQLASLYEVAAGQGRGTAHDPAYKTVGELVAGLHASAQTLLGEGLLEIRQAISAELAARLPTSPAAALDQATRDAAAGQFRRMAALLGGLH